MKQQRKPRKLSKAGRIARTLHQQIGFDRSQRDAIKREEHLRSLMGLPSRVFSDGTSIRDEP
jgi:hypothetical protein